MAHRIPTVNQSAAELKLQIEAERAGEPFLVLRDPGGAQRLIPLADRERLVIGREQGVDLRIDGDEAISRLHAELARVGRSWVIADDGLSSNGTFVDGERLRTRRRLRDRDLILVGETGVLYREPAAATRRRRRPGPLPGGRGARAGRGAAAGSRLRSAGPCSAITPSPRRRRRMRRSRPSCS